MEGYKVLVILKSFSRLIIKVIVLIFNYIYYFCPLYGTRNVKWDIRDGLKRAL